MICDSVHSKIGRNVKNIPVYTPEGWERVVRMARMKPSPFEVIKLQHDDFLNFNERQVKLEMVY